MRLHLIALPHTVLTWESLSCAYTQKMRRAIGMFQAEGHEVILYGPDAIDVAPDEHVVIATSRDRKRWGFAEGFNTATTPFSWDIAKPYWRRTNKLAAAAVRDRATPDDLLLLTTSTQWPIAAANPDLTVAEWTVGYEGIYERDRWHCAFESHAWRHHVYGLRGWRNGRTLDTVIPNFFDPADFQLSRKHEWLLYLGRIIDQKGIQLAAEIAAATGRQLIAAGPGGTIRDGHLVTAEGHTIAGDVSYLGEIGAAERRYVLARAAALLVPTVYLEPFGGVAVEAMLSGTPVVASDWGAFTETVTPDVGGRFATAAQAEVALEHALTLDPAAIREAAIARFGLRAVGPLFTRWFQTFAGVRETLHAAA